MRIHAITLAAALGLAACSGDDGDSPPVEPGYQGQHVGTLEFADDDNSEVVKMLPDGSKAVLVASKTRKVTLLGVSPSGLTELRSANLFPDDVSESELTHIDFDSRGRFAVVTRTLPITDEAGMLADCRGSLVFVDVSDSDAFGAVLHEVAVGPMPDAVDISPDDRWVVSADEQDAYDKCDIEGVTPAVSLLELPDGDPTAARVRARITLSGEETGLLREPEQIIFAADSDTVAATLQDSHEVLIVSRSAVLAGAGEEVVELDGNDPANVLAMVRLPDRADGAEPWPDGLDVFTDAAGEQRLIVTGEYNDVLYTLGLDGAVLGTALITDDVVPGDFPRVTADDDVRFRPDSVAAFTYDGVPYGAVSLKHSGAVGVWDLSDPADIYPVSMVKVGAGEGASSTEESTLGCEGISARDGVIITANEDESSASLVTPLQ